MNLESVKPTIVIDNREQAPLVFTTFVSIKGTLRSGDYSIQGMEELFSIERKSIPDLVASCVANRTRFEAELHRLRGYKFTRLLIVGIKEEIEQHRYRSQVSPKSILASLTAFEIRYNIPVVWCATPELAASQIERWVYYFSREILKVSQNLQQTIQNHE